MEKITEKIKLYELKAMSKNFFGNMVNGVVDVDKKIIGLDAALHADIEAFLLKSGSSQKDLWGINLYPDFYGEEDFIEFDSMINIRPVDGNRTTGIDSKDLQLKITDIINSMVEK